MGRTNRLCSINLNNAETVYRSKMFYITPVFTISDRDEPSPVYTTLANGNKVEVGTDAVSYIIAAFSGLTLFAFILIIPYFCKIKLRNL